MNELIYKEILVELEKTFTIISPQSPQKKNKIPIRIKWKGNYIVTKSGKTVWPHIGAAKNAFWNHMAYLCVPSLKPINTYGRYDHRDKGENIVIYHLFPKDRETLEYLNTPHGEIDKKLRAQFLEKLQEDGILEFEPQNS